MAALLAVGWSRRRPARHGAAVGRPRGRLAANGFRRRVAGRTHLLQRQPRRLAAARCCSTSRSPWCRSSALAPLIGPAIDRFRRGQRLVAATTYGLPAVVCVVLAAVLFDLAFTCSCSPCWWPTGRPGWSSRLSSPGSWATARICAITNSRLAKLPPSRVGSVCSQPVCASARSAAPVDTAHRRAVVPVRHADHPAGPARSRRHRASCRTGVRRAALPVGGGGGGRLHGDTGRRGLLRVHDGLHLPPGQRATVRSTPPPWSSTARRFLGNVVAPRLAVASARSSSSPWPWPPRRSMTLIASPT